MYHIADFVIRLKNAAKARRKKVLAQNSNINKAIAKLLKTYGFLDDVKEETVNGKKMISVAIRYEQRNPVITDVKVVSKPSLRVYITAKAVKEYRKGLAVTVISTNQGIMTSTDAQKKGIGGEVLFRIW